MAAGESDGWLAEVHAYGALLRLHSDLQPAVLGVVINVEYGTYVEHRGAQVEYSTLSSNM